MEDVDESEAPLSASDSELGMPSGNESDAMQDVRSGEDEESEEDDLEGELEAMLEELL